MSKNRLNFHPRQTPDEFNNDGLKIKFNTDKHRNNSTFKVQINKQI